MFERFTDRARRAVVLAQEEARTMNHNYIGTEHLLLGLLAEGEGVAAVALRELGADTDVVRARVMDEVAPGGTSPPEHHIPFTSLAKKTMERSLSEALKLGHNYIGTEHLLLGLLAEGEGVAAQVLVGMGIGLGDVRGKVVALLAGLGAARPSSSRAPAPPPSSGRRSPALDAALAQARGLAGDDLVGTHHLLAVLTVMDDAAATRILEAGGFDPASLPVEIASWDVRGTGDEDPVARATRGTVLIQDESGMMVRLDDESLHQRIVAALSEGRLSEDQLREALGRVWAGLAETADGGDGGDGPRDGPEDGNGQDGDADGESP